MFQAPVRQAIQKNRRIRWRPGGSQGGHQPADRQSLPPLLRLAEPVAKNLLSGRPMDRGFVRGLSQAAARGGSSGQRPDRYVRPARSRIIALAEAARPTSRDSITEGVPTELAVIRNGPRIRPFLYASADFASMRH